MKKYFISACCLLSSFQAAAVYLSQNGLGEVQLLPYYTTNGDLNTLVSVTNTTEASKAVKINLREGLNGYAVLSYNVYLDAYDTWTFALVGSLPSSYEPTSEDQPLHIASDKSCVPFLNNPLQEFQSQDLVDGPQNISRMREGFIEIIEMGELQGDFIDHADMGLTGVPNNCEAFEAAWETGGVWHSESGGDPKQDLAPANGGLMAQIDIINVNEGLNFSIPVTALDGFFAADQVAHVPPADVDLSLDAAAPEATVVTNEKTYQLAFETGIDAVSAVLMADEVIGTYAIDSIVAGKSEIVLTQPTRRFYINNDQNIAEPPYQVSLEVVNCSNENYGGVEVDQKNYDRNSQFYERNHCEGIGTCPGAPPKDAICGSVFIQSVKLRENPPTFRSSITSSNNYEFIDSPFLSHATENGFVSTRFVDTRPLRANVLNSDQMVEITGLPVLGVTLQQSTNAGAADGLLAQYGGAQRLKTKVEVIEL